MQRPDDMPKPARPSLLTPAQQAEADRNRILSTLESGGVAARPATRRRGGRLLWAGVGVAVLAVLAAATTWMQRDASDSRTLAAIAQVGGAAPAGSPASAGQSPATATALTTDPATQAQAIAPPPAAAPAPAVIQEDPAAQAQAHGQRQSLSEMLNAGGEQPAKPAPDLLAKALETPPAAAVKPASKPKPKPQPVKAAPRAPSATPEQENDIALLSALVAHSQAAEPKKVRLSLHEQLAQCRELGKDKAQQCRARVCEGRSSAGECGGHR